MFRFSGKTRYKRFYGACKLYYCQKLISGPMPHTSWECRACEADTGFLKGKNILYSSWLSFASTALFQGLFQAGSWPKFDCFAGRHFYCFACGGIARISLRHGLDKEYAKSGQANASIQGQRIFQGIKHCIEEPLGPGHLQAVFMGEKGCKFCFCHRSNWFGKRYGQVAKSARSCQAVFARAGDIAFAVNVANLVRIY